MRFVREIYYFSIHLEQVSVMMLGLFPLKPLYNVKTPFLFDNYLTIMFRLEFFGVLSSVSGLS